MLLQHDDKEWGREMNAVINAMIDQYIAEGGGDTVTHVVEAIPPIV